jgi:phage gpG-like protein
MSTLVIKLTHNAQEIANRLAVFPPAMLAGIARAMDKENELTVGHVGKNYLTGPRPEKLGVRTNRLRLSIRRSAATIDGQRVTSDIGTNVEYAAIHEYGFTGEVAVKAHARRIFARGRSRSGKRTEIESETFISKKGGIIRRVKTKIRYTRGTATVKAHRRPMKMPARPYLAPSVADRTENYSQSISRAIIAAWEGGAS